MTEPSAGEAREQASAIVADWCREAFKRSAGGLPTFAQTDLLEARIACALAEKDAALAEARREREARQSGYYQGVKESGAAIQRERADHLEADLAAMRGALECGLDDPGILGLHTDEDDCAACRIRMMLRAALASSPGDRVNQKRL